MRLPVVLAACALVAGCSATADQHGQPGVAISEPSLSAAAPSSRPSTAAPKAAPTTAPPPGAPVADVIAWVEAGTPVDVAGFHTATRDGAPTNLGGDVAFTTTSGANCMTDKGFGGALACLVHLTAPPPRPADAYGHWVGGWVDFEGPTAEVGSVHGDPGRFTNGTGPQLKNGQSLRFGDYQCRADAAGPVCVNYARRTAVRFSNDGIQTFGCLTPVTPAPDGFGLKFACTAT
ncbi:hypothetical protein BOO86_01495 [Mycobacterium sp. CBMA 234]|uniref:hypothetical protein n=1 Tax=Mycolicibacterium sp. CBMA 234 TaxID=1918495 RepID=UPI0012DCF55C|nr:hypothetical protein [Mycolicibacterium sp. CBMA 234]MUL63124.1 hypothetical protein [Mycolicibacterium sp. CBMA 234]